MSPNDDWPNSVPGTDDLPYDLVVGPDGRPRTPVDLDVTIAAFDRALDEPGPEP